MQKLKNFLMSMNFAITMFVVIGLRIVVVGATVGDALAIAALCGLQAFNKWSELKNREQTYAESIKKQQDLNMEVMQQLEDIKTSMSSLMIKSSVRPNAAPVVEKEQMKRFF